MQNKLEWMTQQADADETGLESSDIRLILEGSTNFTDAEVEYVLELSEEWDQELPDQ